MMMILNFFDKVWGWIAGLFSSKRLWRSLRDIRDDVLDELIEFGVEEAQDLSRQGFNIDFEDYPGKLWNRIEEWAELQWDAVILPEVREAIMQEVIQRFRDGR